MNQFFLKSLTVWLLFVLSVKPLLAQWQQTRGPCGGSVTCISPDVNGIWVGSETGLLFSPDNGVTWIDRNQDLPHFVISFLSSGNTLYAGTSDNGVYISSDNGSTWEWTSLNNTGVHKLVKIGENIFAGTGRGVYLSSNNGGNWVPVNSGLTNTSILAMAVKENDVFAGCWDGVFRSSDNGDNWVAINDGLPDAKIIVSLDVAGNNLYAVTEASGVFISTNNGDNWTPVNNGLPQLYMGTLAAGENAVFATTWSEILYRSTDAGNNWSRVDNLSTIQICTLAVTGDTIYAGSGQHGLFQSVDNGITWVPIGFVNTYVQCLADRGVNILAGLFECNNNGGLLVSEDHGVNWKSSNFNYGSAYAFDSNGSFTFAAWKGVAKSSDNGTTWVPTTSIFINNDVRALAIRGDMIFAGTHGNGVFVSSDNGNNWDPANSGMEYTDVYALVVNDNDLFAGIAGGIYRSPDNGNSWYKSNSGLTNTWVLSLTVIGMDLFAGTALGLFRSQDSGHNWTETGLMGSWVNSILNYEDKIFAATEHGVFLSRDNGVTWDTANTGLINKDIRTLLINDDKILAGSFGMGVWQRSIMNLVGEEEHTNPHYFKIYPNPARDKITIETSVRSPKGQVSIVNLTGQEYMKQTITEPSTQVNINRLPSGIYFVRITGAETVKVGKIIKQ
ncbi:MAG: T9SS type A sorting domain-containing protein [Bacteroidales bacterium]|jgi:photosystem II stability/assembly factor-like uncharacterized protein|nr:T9SS type A sorting domain-containing protein [Bacteroidales bacterium]